MSVSGWRYCLAESGHNTSKSGRTRGITRVCWARDKKQNGAPLFFCLYISAQRLTPCMQKWQAKKKKKKKKKQKKKKKRISHISHTFSSTKTVQIDKSWTCKLTNHGHVIGPTIFLRPITNLYFLVGQMVDPIFFLHLTRFCAPWKWRPGKCPPYAPHLPRSYATG